MKSGVRILSVGLDQSLDMAYGALLVGRPCEITTVRHRGELNEMPTNENFDVAILGEQLPNDRLVETASVIRRRWPRANILAVSSRPLGIDDTLYDERILPGYSAKVLIAEVLRLLDEHRRQRSGIASVWEC